MKCYRLGLLLLPVSLAIGAGERASVRAAASGTPRPEAVVGQFDRVIPIVLNGEGFKTSFVLTNLDTKTIFFTLFFHAPDGNLVELPVAEVGSVSSLHGTLPVNQTLTFETDGSGQLQEGYASFYTLDRPASDSAAGVVLANLGGMAMIRTSTFESPVPIVPSFETRFTLPFENGGGVQTAAVLLNHSTRPSPLAIVVRDLSGNVLTTDFVTLDALQQITALLADIYPETTDKSGVIQVSTASIGLSGLGIRLNAGGTFTTVQTLSTDIDAEAPKPPATIPTGTLPGTSCSSIQGAIVFANDGQYLGKVTSNTFDLESLGNQYGRYGSEYSSTSIFNKYGKYGGEYAALSPFNPYTSTPPILVLNERALAYLTVNRSKTPGITPTALYPCIGRR
jgi:hypothetical protein